MKSPKEVMEQWLPDDFLNLTGQVPLRLAVYNENKIARAMDEYAKQVAIGFAKFIVDGGWDKVAGDNYGEAFFVNPPEELFELYKSKL